MDTHTEQDIVQFLNNSVGLTHEGHGYPDYSQDPLALTQQEHESEVEDNIPSYVSDVIKDNRRQNTNLARVRCRTFTI